MPQVNRWICVGAGLLLTVLSGSLMAQGPSKELAIKLMSLPPRPKRPDLPVSKLPLEFLQGERVDSYRAIQHPLQQKPLQLIAMH